jgi:hypothetical protein
MNTIHGQLTQGTFLDAVRDASCKEQGEQAEQLFARLRGEKIVRPATQIENRDEHWDLLDKDFGKVDVKSAKRLRRNGGVDYTIWWELKTVKRPPDNKPQRGWGVGNGMRRYIALRLPEGFYLLSPEEVSEDLRLMNRRAEMPRGRCEFGLYSREGREDLMTILPDSYVRKNARHFVEVRP